jgi:mono/diheme cytochrome c family protein
MSQSLRAVLALAVGALVPACHRSTADAESIEKGAQIFVTVCSKCHGLDGKGGVATGSAHAPRNFCDAAFQASHSDDDLKQTIQKGKGAMPPFGNMFSDSDLQGLVLKLRSFVPANVTPPVDPTKGQ